MTPLISLPCEAWLRFVVSRLRGFAMRGKKIKERFFLDNELWKQKQRFFFHQCSVKFDNAVNIMGVLCAL